MPHNDQNQSSLSQEPAPSASAKSAKELRGIELPVLASTKLTVSWTDRTDWMWLKEEKGLISSWAQVLKLTPLVNSMPRRRVCVQAGGAMGIYAAFLSYYFELVVTFEPNPFSFRCLVNNVNDRPNITPLQVALSDEQGYSALICPAGAEANTGAWYTKADPNGRILRMRLDDLKLPALDFMLLDIEGHEVQALAGAVETVNRCRPIIMVEDKETARRKSGAAEDWVASFCADMGYSVSEQILKDYVLVPV